MNQQLNIPEQAQSIYRMRKRNYDTVDIMDAVLEASQHSQPYIKPFLPFLQGSTELETCRNIWEFLKYRITYKEDPEGWQIVKAPSQLWATKTGDCKSYSVFANAALQAFGIESFFRFAAYENPLDANHNPAIPTHVYVVAKDAGHEIIIDGVWTSFNEEKLPIYKKYDRMPLVYIAGTKPAANQRRYGKIGRVDLKNSDFTTTTGIQVFKEKIEDKLYKAAPAFIYLFADPMGLPAAARAKRKKAFDFFIEFQNKTKIKSGSFYEFVKVAIKEQLGKEPLLLLPASYQEYITYKKAIMAQAYPMVKKPVKPSIPAGGYGTDAYGLQMTRAYNQALIKYWADMELYESKVERYAIDNLHLWEYDFWMLASKATGQSQRDTRTQIEKILDLLRSQGKIKGTGKVGIDPATATIIVAGISAVITILTMVVQMSKNDLPDIPKDYGFDPNTPPDPDNPNDPRNAKPKDELSNLLLPLGAGAAAYFFL